MPTDKYFIVALSADFLDENRKLIFPDIGLSLLDADPVIDHKFVADYQPEYVPQQLAGVDVLITLKPRVTAASLQGIAQLSLSGDAAWDTITSISPPAPSTTLRSTSLRPESYGPSRRPSS